MSIKKLLVTGQNAKNTFKLTAGDTGCPECDTSIPFCQNTAAFAQAGGMTALVVQEKGVNKTLAVTPANVSAEAVAAAILAALKLADYEDWGGDPQGVVVNDLGTNLQVILTGNIKAVSITHGGGTATFTQACTLTNECTYTITGYAGGAATTAATNLRINGGNHDLGAITAGTTTAGAVSTAVQAALAAAGVLGTAATTTTGSGGSQTYNITITGSESDNTIVLNGTYLTRSGCAPVYV